MCFWTNRDTTHYLPPTGTLCGHLRSLILTRKEGFLPFALALAVNAMPDRWGNMLVGKSAGEGPFTG